MGRHRSALRSNHSVVKAAARSIVQTSMIGTIAVFLNYRTPHDTIRAVRSLQESESKPAAIIVVDNASNDGSRELLESNLRDIHLIAADRNGGFSEGCNIGIREALARGGRRVLLLNSDTLVPPDMLGTLEQALDADLNLGIVGPVIVSMSDPGQVQSMGISYTQSTGRMRHQGFGARRSPATASARDVDGISGCAMLIRRELIERIGLLTEDYFFGFEDLDFCLRARAAGFRTACVDTATVLHEGSVSMGRQSGQRIYFATRNHLMLAHRFAGRRTAVSRWFQCSAILALNLAYVLKGSEVPRRAGLAAFVAGVRDYFAGRFG
jgi:GT2 family glycosyltransferase